MITHTICCFWRRGRDSNPRCGFPHNGFQDRRNRPLCHPSGPSLCILHFLEWQGGRDSNPQPTVLETATLPIELPPFAFEQSLVSSWGRNNFASLPLNQATMSDTRPAPIVRPPSRMANLCPFSIATGAMSSMSTETLSPGMTISTPCASLTVPVTSVVRK